MYRIYYPSIPNMGDRLNKVMLEDLFGIEVIQTPFFKSNMSAIGSSLEKLLWSESAKTRLKQGVRYAFAPKERYVWGTGFLSSDICKESALIFKNTHFCAIRGELSKKRIEDIIGEKLNIPTGDGGLLAERWLGSDAKKKYSIGIIPHFKEQDHPLLKSIAGSYKDSVIIDLTDEPRSVVKKISECNTVLSSSLHGLIVSDSFHIPNMHMMLYQYEERMLGDGFKFRDYYSAYGTEDKPVFMENGEWPSVDGIVNSYGIDPKMVEKKKNQLYGCFPRELS